MAIDDGVFRSMDCEGCVCHTCDMRMHFGDNRYPDAAFECDKCLLCRRDFNAEDHHLDRFTYLCGNMNVAGGGKNG